MSEDEHEHEPARVLAESGQFVSLATLFERERREHAKDHEQERAVAKETAQRLEREVEQTALRLERVVEETALRIEKAVTVALVAVADTARVHADGHSKEHLAHERIHTVEKDQVQKAEQAMNKRLEGMNEFRAALQDQSNRAVTREYYDTRHEDLKQKVVDADSALAAKIGDLERRSASADAVEAYKKVVYSAVIVGVVSLCIALFNLVTKT